MSKRSEINECQWCETVAIKDYCHTLAADSSTGLPYADCEHCGTINPVGARCGKCGRTMPQWMPDADYIARATAAIRDYNNDLYAKDMATKHERKRPLQDGSLRHFITVRRGRCFTGPYRESRA